MEGLWVSCQQFPSEYSRTQFIGKNAHNYLQLLSNHCNDWIQWYDYESRSRQCMRYCSYDVGTWPVQGPAHEVPNNLLVAAKPIDLEFYIQTLPEWVNTPVF